ARAPISHPSDTEKVKDDRRGNASRRTTVLPHGGYWRGPGKPEPGRTVRVLDHREDRAVRQTAGAVMAQPVAALGRADADLVVEGPGVADRAAARTDVPQLPGDHRTNVRADERAVQRHPPAGIRALPGVGGGETPERVLRRSDRPDLVRRRIHHVFRWPADGPLGKPGDRHRQRP